MIDDDDLKSLGKAKTPAPSQAARERALSAAMAAFDEKPATAPQGTADDNRLTAKAISLWRSLMSRNSLTGPAIAGLLVLPLAGYTTYALMQTSLLTFRRDAQPAAPQPAAGAPAKLERKVKSTPAPIAESMDKAEAVEEDAPASEPAVTYAAPPPAASGQAMDSSQPMLNAAPQRDRSFAPSMATKRVQVPGQIVLEPSAQALPDNERLTEFSTNPVKSALEDPVSNFSIDVDTASYALVRRSLKEGVLPQPDSVRVEEMVNYFPYNWQGPDSAETPFKANVALMPTPWNANTKLMHIAIKGYQVPQAQKPRANLVFLIDVSGSMDQPDKLPLLKSSFRMLVNQMAADDTISIVTYAGDAGTVLEPTKASDKARILAAIDNLTPGGSTAGEAGIREAYRLAEASFVKDGVNRVMLATDGDFNVGQTDDDDLKRLIEQKRQSGVFLSVLGFGRGNLNDAMMQEIAQNGNGQAAYIDTLAEAEKALVQEAGSTLFPIAKDVKIQVEFNPEKIAEYRLIGYETRALNREDFNDDKKDAGEIGSGHSVTAIYEVTPKGSPAQQIDDLRYGQARSDNPTGISNGGEYAFVKIRYKAPDGDVSKLITQPITAANDISTFAAASEDQRFSVAVAAFGQKLRNTSQLGAFSYDEIGQLATAARGADPFGYRGEFLSLVRLAAGLDGAK
jgi:Ca-activated chloride channel family protein